MEAVTRSPFMLAPRRSLGVQLKAVTAPSLRVSLLGPVRLRAGTEGSWLSVPRRTLPVLAYVLLHRGRPVLRADLASALWPDDENARGRARLRSHLHALSRALPPGRNCCFRRGERDVERSGVRLARRCRVRAAFIGSRNDGSCRRALFRRFGGRSNRRVDPARAE